MTHALSKAQQPRTNRGVNIVTLLLPEKTMAGTRKPGEVILCFTAKVN
jgi:hypothetical protein